MPSAVVPQAPNTHPQFDAVDGPPILQTYLQTNEFKSQHCDFDSITVSGMPSVLKAVEFTALTVGGTAIHRGPSDFFVVATSPFVISCDQTKKPDIIKAIQSSLKDEPQIPHTNPKFLLKHPVTIFAASFASILQD